MENNNTSKDFDWESFRRDMARDTLIALVSDYKAFSLNRSYDSMAIVALNATDALIRRLKGEIK